MRITALAGAVALAATALACQADAPGDPEPETTRTGSIFGGSVQSSGQAVGRSDGQAADRSESGTTAAPPSASMSTAGGDRIPVAEIPPGQPVDVADMGFTVGSGEAPIRVIEFSDFGCGYCRRFHLETYPTLHQQYVQTGQVVWKYVPFVLGIFPNGEEAAIAGECVLQQGPEGFPGFRDRLFSDQSAWKDAQDPTDHFVAVAEDEGVDGPRMRECIVEEETRPRVEDNIALGRRVGVRGTPAFLVNGVPLQGAQPVFVFQGIFDQIIAMEAEEAGSE